MPFKLVSMSHSNSVGITWYQQYHQWHCQDDQKEEATWHFWSFDAIGTSISIMWCQWHHQWYHCICLVKIFKMRHHITFLGHITYLVLALASFDTDGIVNGPTAFLSSRWSKWDATLCFGHVTPLASAPHDAICGSIMWSHWNWCQHHVIQKALPMAPLHFSDQDGGNEVQHDILGHVMPLELVSVSHGTSVGIIRCQECHQWYHCIH